MQAYSFENTPCSDAISGLENRVFDINSGHDFCRYRNFIQVIDFQINVGTQRCDKVIYKYLAVRGVSLVELDRICIFTC